MAKKRCYGCMKMKTQVPVCEHCGYNEHVQNESHQLPTGAVLNNQYTIGKCLGQGGFGITYLGWDQFLDIPVAIKEYYPNGFVSRDCRLSTEVVILENKAGALFQSSRERFMREAQTLAKLSSVPGVVHVRNFFLQNNTAYIVMEYLKGIDLRRYMNMHGGRLSIQETLKILHPIMDAMITVHKAGIVHRDISPDNIMILPDGSVKLLDFGAVRNVESDDAEQDLPKSTEAILKHGFAPIEQYQRRGALGPWTDVYALCANVFYCATGKIPPDAPDRMMEDLPIKWELIPGLTPRQRDALERGTAIRAKDRYANVDQLVADLYAESAAPSGQPQPAPQQVIRPSQYASQQVPKQSQYASQQVPKQSQYASQQVPKQSQYASQQVPKQSQYASQQVPKQSQYASQQIPKQSQYGSQQPGPSQYGQQPGYPQYAPQGQQYSQYQQPGQPYPQYPQGQQYGQYQQPGYPQYPQGQQYPQYQQPGQQYPYYGQPGQPYPQYPQGQTYPQYQQPGYPQYPQGQQYPQYPPQPGQPYPQYQQPGQQYSQYIPPQPEQQYSQYLQPQAQPAYEQPAYVPQQPVQSQVQQPEVAADLGKTVPVALMDEEPEETPIPVELGRSVISTPSLAFDAEEPEEPEVEETPEIAPVVEEIIEEPAEIEPAVEEIVEEPAAEVMEEASEPVEETSEEENAAPVIATASLDFLGFEEEEEVSEEPAPEVIEEVIEEPVVEEVIPEAVEEVAEEAIPDIVWEEAAPVIEEIPLAIEEDTFQAEDFGETVAVIPEPMVEEVAEEAIPDIVWEEAAPVIEEIPLAIEEDTFQAEDFGETVAVIPEPVVEEPIEEPVPDVVEEVIPEAVEEVAEEAAPDIVWEEAAPVIEEIPLAIEEDAFQAEDFGETVAVIPEPVVEEPVEEPIPEVIEEVIEEPVAEEVVEEVAEEATPDIVWEEAAPVVEEIPLAIEEGTFQAEDFGETVAVIPEPVVEEPIEEPIPEVVEEVIEEPIPEVIEAVAEEATPDIVWEEAAPVIEEIPLAIEEDTFQAEDFGETVAVVEEPIEEPIPEVIEEAIPEAVEEVAEEATPDIVWEEAAPVIEEIPLAIEEDTFQAEDFGETVAVIPEPVVEEPIEEPIPEVIEEPVIEEVPVIAPVIAPVAEEPPVEIIPPVVAEPAFQAEEFGSTVAVIHEPVRQAEEFGATVAVTPAPVQQAEDFGRTVAAPVVPEVKPEPRKEPKKEPKKDKKKNKSEPKPKSEPKKPEPKAEVKKPEPKKAEPKPEVKKPQPKKPEPKAAPVQQAATQEKAKNKLLIPIIAAIVAVVAVAVLVLGGGKDGKPVEPGKPQVSQGQTENLEYNLEREPVIYANSTATQTFQDHSYMEIVTDSNGNEIRRNYHQANGNLIRRDEASYDENGNMVSMTGYDDTMTAIISREWEYNADGKVTKLTTYLDGKEFSTGVYEYDSHGELAHWTETAADGTLLDEITYENEYDKKGVKLSCLQTDFDGSRWEVTYDKRGNAVTEINWNNRGQKTRYENVFNEYGEETEFTTYDGEGNMIRHGEYIWDDQGRMTMFVSYTAEGEEDYSTDYICDAHGNRYAGNYKNRNSTNYWEDVLDISGYTIRYFSTYKDLEHNYQSKSTDYYNALGNVEYYESYSEGALSYKAEYRYDEYGRSLGHTGTSYNTYDGTYTVYQYDENGNHTEAKMYDSNGTYIGYIEEEYDEDGRPTHYMEKRPDGSVISERITRYNAEGREVYYQYIEYTQSGTVKSRSESQYDDQGRQISWIYEDFESNYYSHSETQYDGNVSTETYYDRNGSEESRRVTTYDDQGIRISEEYEDIKDGYYYYYEYRYEGDITITTCYDRDGKVMYRQGEQRTENGLIVQYSYDDAYNIESIYVYDRNYNDLLNLYGDAEGMAAYQPVLNVILKMNAEMVQTMADDLEALYDLLYYYDTDITEQELEQLLADMMMARGFEPVEVFGYDPFTQAQQPAETQPVEKPSSAPVRTGSVMRAFPLSDSEGDGSGASAFGLSIKREDVALVRFMGDQYAEGAVDISEAGDGSVVAWFSDMPGGKYQVSISGNGGVAAPVNCDQLFSGFRNLETIEFNGAFHTDGVKSMNGMFAYCKALVDLDLSSFNTADVTDMGNMFYMCNHLKSVNVSSFDTACVTNMSGMFATGQNFAIGGGSLSALQSLDLSNFNTAKVTDMSSMFNNCDSLKTLNIGSFNTASVTNMSYMFNGCAKISMLDLGGFNTSRVTNMSYMFFGCNSLWPDYTKFDVSNVTEYENFMNGTAWHSFFNK